MDFEDAITAHLKWKIQLRLRISREDETLTSKVASNDLACTLGRWLRDEGKRYSNTGLYKDLLRSHAKFHDCAADVVRLVERGEPDQASAMLDQEFNAASKDVIRLILSADRVYK